MMAAYYSKSPLAVKLLLEEGADPTVTNKNGNTAQELAQSANQAQSAAYIQAFVQAWELKALADQEAAQAEAQEAAEK
jgi:ankyrin repeat protein